jgi:RHH-type proline utilization regulon transcriptional repressor/proline dehydrogenase/delta 1-pyrroline-5-carboxylate dehydrogenase
VAFDEVAQRGSTPSVVSEPDEKRVVALAKEINRLGGKQKAGAYEMSRTTRLMMRFAMKMPEFQTQLFRFVDVFPAMGDDDDTTEHLGEYFAPGTAPALVAKGVKLASAVPGGPHIAARVARREISRMAQQFIVGTDAKEASAALGKLWSKRTAATIDLLGEHTFSHSEAAAYAARLARLVDTLLDASERWAPQELLERDDVGSLPRVAVSIKPSALAPDFTALTDVAGLETVKGHLRPILATAARRGAQVWFDLERYETKELTHRLFRELLAEPGFDDLHAGIVLQAYLRDSAEDLVALLEWSGSRTIPIAVRLVKGAYWDTETIVAEAAGWPVPVYEHKAETDLNYEHCTRILHAHHGQVRAAFASHNLRSLAYAIETARLAGIPDNGYEVQLLYGMAEPVHEAIRRLGFRLRVYAPMGELVPGMAYLVRRLLENTSQDSFVRNRFADGKDLDGLLAKPKLPAGAAAAGGAGHGTSSAGGAAAGGAGHGTSAAGGSGAGEAGRTNSAGGSGVSGAGHGEPGAGEYRPDPLAEWFRSEVREEMAAAVLRMTTPSGLTPAAAARVKATPPPERAEVPATGVPGGAFGLDRYVAARIAGEDVRTARSIVSVNPADPVQTVATSACCGPSEAMAAVEACAKAYASWSRRPAEDRAGVMFRAAQWMRERHFDISALQVFEAGKGWPDADGDVCEAIDFLEYYGRQAIRMSKGGHVQSPPGETNRLTYRGRGVTVVISPWNFPLAIPTGMVSAALVTGNTVVLKPAEQTPAIARVLVDALDHAGLPPGVLSFVPGIGEEIGDGLVTHPDVAGISFTGSKAVGLHLNEIGARTLPGQREVRRVFAEMGGKNALIVDTDADLDVAVPAAVSSAFGFAGQRCSAASRVVVVGEVAGGFLERFVEAARALCIGIPEAMGTEMGPVIDEDAVKRIRNWQERANEYGRVLLQREDVPDKGYFVGPTIVDGVDPSAALACEEIFGPVVAVEHARDFDHAIELANASEYALTAGLISRSPSHIRRAAEELEAGNIYINRGIVGAIVGRQPFGGHAMSGFGQKAGGPDYLYQFVEPRVVTENTMRQGFAPASEQ